MDKVVGVLGGGQLGRMLLQAASPLAIPVVSLDPDSSAPAKQVAQPQLLPLEGNEGEQALRHLDGKFTDAKMIRQLADQADVLTVEIEHVDVEALAEVAKELANKGGRSGNGVKVYPSPEVIALIQDKFTQKERLAEAGVPVANFCKISAFSSGGTSSSRDVRDSLVDSVREAGDRFGYPLMLKSRRLAYDGRGNYVLKSDSDKDIAEALRALIPDSSIQHSNDVGERLYAEQMASFEKEVAVMVVRGADGTTRCFPAVETIHKDSICHVVYAPVRPPRRADTGLGAKQCGNDPFAGTDLAQLAQDVAQGAIDKLGQGAVGVFGVEMFLMASGERLLVNEIAPRPHNSGHYTIESCMPTQYAAHLYAILGLPLPPVQFMPAAAAMVNLLGASDSAVDDFHKPDGGVVRRAIELGAAVHLYGKRGCRRGRKMGHITLVGESDDAVHTKVARLLDALPGPYREPLDEQASGNAAGVSSERPLVSIVMGSDSDLPVMRAAAQMLSLFAVPYELSIVSAHRTAARMASFAHAAAQRGVRVIIAGAGGAAHLPGMLASETTLPVIGVPVKGSSLDGVDSLYSIVQMPRGIPVATVGVNNATNAGLLAVRILSTHVPILRTALETYASNLEKEVMGKVDVLEQIGWDSYVKDQLKK